MRSRKGAKNNFLSHKQDVILLLTPSMPTSPVSLPLKCKCAHCKHLPAYGAVKNQEDEQTKEDGEGGSDYLDYEGEDEADEEEKEHDSDPPLKYTDADFARGLQEEPAMQPKTREKLFALEATEGEVNDQTLHAMLQRITIDIEAHIQHPEWVEAICGTPVASIFDVHTVAQMGRIVPELPCKKMIVISARFRQPLELPVVSGLNLYSFDVSASVHVDKEHWFSWSGQSSVPRETETETWSLQRDATNALVLRLKRFNQYENSPVMYATFSASSPRQWTGVRIILESTRLALMIQTKDEDGTKRATGCCGTVPLIPVAGSIFVPPALVVPAPAAPVVDPAPTTPVDAVPAPAPVVAPVNALPLAAVADVGTLSSLLSSVVSSAVTAAVNAALSHCQCKAQ